MCLFYFILCVFLCFIVVSVVVFCVFLRMCLCWFVFVFVFMVGCLPCLFKGVLCMCVVVSSCVVYSLPQS